MTQLLGALVADAGLAAVEVRGTASVVVTGVVYDSRRVETGSLFCCLRGTNSDGHEFAAGAVAAGAAALLVDHALDLAVTQVIVPDTRAAMGPLSSAFFDHPSRIADDRRCHGHERQDDDHQPDRRRARGRRHADRGHRHAHRQAHHARGARTCRPNWPASWPPGSGRS